MGLLERLFGRRKRRDDGWTPYDPGLNQQQQQQQQQQVYPNDDDRGDRGDRDDRGSDDRIDPSAQQIVVGDDQGPTQDVDVGGQGDSGDSGSSDSGGGDSGGGDSGGGGGE